MDVIIVCHTEFGLVRNGAVIADKSATDGVSKGVRNLIEVADKYDAKITFAVMPEVSEYFPDNTGHEIGLHIHPGWQEFQKNGMVYRVGDSYLRTHCNLSGNSTVLRDYAYEEQLELIRAGKEQLEDRFGIDLRSFVAGRWSINNDTVKALMKTGFSHDCSAVPHSKPCHYNWSELPRICMPYHPSDGNYQKKGELPLLIVPISQYWPSGNVNPEAVSFVGLPWIKSCFIEYEMQGVPLFHICLHSPCMCDRRFARSMDELLSFVSKYDVEFKFASDIKRYKKIYPTTKFQPYLRGITATIINAGLRSMISRIVKL